MLTSLKIQNLILIENAAITFGPGLNILTGETGAGKSAILAAIKLISGERADVQLIREGTDLAVVEATLTDFIDCGEIDFPEKGKPIHIRREIHRSGKSRCFVEDQQVTLGFLKKCISLERVDQSSSQSLLAHDQQRHMLDSFGGLVAEAMVLEKSFEKEKSMEAELESLLHLGGQRERELEWAQKDLSLIEEVNWKKEEEDKLNAEHHLLTHGQELLEKVGAISSALSEGSQPIVPFLKRSTATLENCHRIDPKLTPIAAAMKNGALELEEVTRLLSSYLESLDADPARLDAVEKRIAAIESIKRRFGPNVEEEKEKLLAKIDRLTHLDEQIQTIGNSLTKIKEDNLKLAGRLSEKRQKAAKSLSKVVLEEIQSLNLPHAQFTIAVKPKPISPTGIDEISFLFSANPGVPPTSLDQCASGGELSRLLLAIKTVLADGASCLVFDEIDSNVGGQTATILGEKLKRLAERRQVICVTHFVQVARIALNHFLVYKKEDQGRAKTFISPLKAKEREQEYQRMLGNKL